MSVLAGFDMVIELSRDKLEALITTATLGGQSLTPPTEVDLSDAGNGVFISLMIFDPVTLSISPSKQPSWATISIPFDDSSFTFKGQTLTPAKGTLRIAGFFDMALVPPTSPTSPPFAQQVAFFPRAVTHTFDEGAPYCAQALAALSDRAGFEATMDTDLGEGLLTKSLAAGPRWMIDPTQNGTIGGRFCNLTVHPISDQVVGLFGTILARNLNQGDLSQKTVSLAAGASVAVSVSAEAFHDMIWCPTLGGSAAALANQPGQLAQYLAANLPPDCGGASQALLPGGKGTWLTGSSIQFDQGLIHLKGNVFYGNEGAYCFRASGTFATDLTLVIKNGSLQPQLNPDPPSTDITLDVSWYCALLWAVGALIGGLITVFAAAIAWEITVVLLDFLISTVTIPALSVNPVQVGFAGISWAGVDITSEGMTLQGTLPTPHPSSNMARGEQLTVSEVDTNVTEVGSGVYHFPGTSVCPPGDFQYVENHIDPVFTITAAVQLIGHPRTFVWTIGETSPVTLKGQSGNVQVNVYPWLPMPDGVGHGLGPTMVTLEYSISADGSTLTLTDRNHYQYSLLVRADCTDGTGATVADWREIGVDGDAIKFGKDYDDFMFRCMVATRDVIGHLRTLPEGIPLGGDPGNLTQEQLVQVLQEAVREGVPGVGAALAEVSAIYGSQVRSDVFVGVVGAQGTFVQGGVSRGLAP